MKISTQLNSIKKKNIISKGGISTFKTIIDFFRSHSPAANIHNPNFVCMRRRETETGKLRYQSVVKCNFYIITLFTDAANSKCIYDGIEITNVDSGLLIRPPGLSYSYVTDKPFNEYNIIFNPDVFSFLKPSLEDEFSFLEIIRIGGYKLEKEQHTYLVEFFKSIYESAKQKDNKNQKIAYLKTLQLFYELEDITNNLREKEESTLSPHQILFKKYLHLVNRFYMEKRSVGDYAKMFSLSPIYFAQIIKSVSNNNPSYHINDRIMREAKSLIAYSGLTFLEIAHQLNFSDSSHLSKFFKKHEGLSPSEYRQKIIGIHHNPIK